MRSTDPIGIAKLWSKSMKSRIFLCGLALFAAEAAHAETAEKAFDGLKIGASVGRNRTSVEQPVAGETAKLDLAKKGVDWRGYVGYDVQTDSNIVLGAELGFGGGGKSLSQKVGATNVKLDPGRTFDASGRLGYALGNSILVFGKAGWAWQNFDVTATSTKIGAKPVDSKIEENGLLFGGGAEIAFSPAFAVRAEYDQVKFNDNLKRSRIMLGGVLRF